MLLFEEKKDFSKEKPCRIRKKPTYKKTDKIKKFLEDKLRLIALNISM